MSRSDTHYLEPSDMLAELDNRFKAFRAALLQEPTQQNHSLAHHREELVCLIDHAISTTTTTATPAPLLYHQPNPNSYFPHQPDEPRKPCFPLKLERKRSRERLERTCHHTKAARSDGPLNSSAGILSRRASQIGPTSLSGALTDFNINGLLSPTSNSDPSPPLYPTHQNQSSPSGNPLKNPFATSINHPFHPHPLAQKPPCDSPNTHHCPSTSYSTLSNTPLISPHDLSVNSNPSENPLLAMINNQLSRHPDLNLKHPERFLDASGESHLGGIEKPNSLHVQLSEIISDTTYQQLPEPITINRPSTSALDSTLNHLGVPPMNSSALVDPNNDREPAFPSSDQQIPGGKFLFPHRPHLPPTRDAEGHPSDRSFPPTRFPVQSITSLMIPGSGESDPSSACVGIESSELSRSSHVVSPTYGLGTRSSNLPTPLHSQPTSALQQDSNDEIMADAMMTNDPLAQPTTLPPPNQSSTGGLQRVYRSSPKDLKPKIRSQARTIDQPSSRTLFTSKDSARSPKNEGGSRLNDVSFQSTGPIQFHPPCSTTSPNIHPAPSDPSLMAGSASSSTYPHQPSHQEDVQPPPRIPSPPVNKQMGAASAGVSDELAAQFEPIFTNWLGRLCSDLDMKDSKGEPIHQTLMARKMQRLEESADFRPFKFRIQAFTNSFFEELVRHGFKEKDLPMKKVRQYLWSQSCISRFNEEGKKAKSKGNHVWHIEAQKILNGQWNFLHFQSKIIANPPTEAYVGVKWTWSAKVWDPQCSAQNIKAVFSSPDLPTWLSWKGNVLSGIPPPDTLGIQFLIHVVATTTPHPRRSSLDLSFKLSVKSREEMVMAREDSKKTKESPVTVCQPNSSILAGSSEQPSLENTSNDSPPDLANQNCNREANAGLGLDANYSAPNPQLPGLSRTDSGESVPISSPSLEELPRQDRLSNRTHLMGNFETVLKENDTDFDSTSAASVLNGMSATTMESVVDALGKYTDMQATVDPEPQPTIDLSNHSLGSIHLVSQGALRPSLPRGMLTGGENQINGLSDLGMINPALGTNLVVEHVSSMMGSGTNDGGGILEQMMVPTTVIPSKPTGSSVMGHPNGPTDLSCIPSDPATPSFDQQALHQARLQTVRENLMSSNIEISDSAGNLMRNAIVSDDPFARQFAADVLAPLTSSTPANNANNNVNLNPNIPNPSNNACCNLSSNSNAIVSSLSNDTTTSLP